MSEIDSNSSIPPDSSSSEEKKSGLNKNANEVTISALGQKIIAAIDNPKVTNQYLRAHLKQRNLDTTGLKPALIKRLRDYIVSNELHVSTFVSIGLNDLLISSEGSTTLFPETETETSNGNGNNPYPNTLTTTYPYHNTMASPLTTTTTSTSITYTNPALAPLAPPPVPLAPNPSLTTSAPNHIPVPMTAPTQYAYNPITNTPYPLATITASNPNGIKLYIGYLSRSSTEHTVREIISPYCHSISDIFMLTDKGTGEFKGVAFLKVPTKEDAENVIANLNAKYIDGDSKHPIVVRIANIQHDNGSGTNKNSSTPTPSTSNPLALSTAGAGAGAYDNRYGLTATTAASYQRPYMYPPPANHYPYYPNTMTSYPPPSTPSPSTSSSQSSRGSTSSTLSYDSRFGYSAPSAGFTGGFGPPPVVDPYMAAAAMMMPQSHLPIQNQKGPEGANLFIYNVPEGYSDADLATMFSSFGTVINSKVQRDANGMSKGFGFISYHTPASASAAILSMDGFVIGNKKLSVRLKDNKGAAQAKPY